MPAVQQKEYMLPDWESRTNRDPLVYHPQDWMVVQKCTSFRPDGTETTDAQGLWHVEVIMRPEGPSFTIFEQQNRHLTPEIRQMIWKAALPEPRVIYLTAFPQVTSNQIVFEVRWGRFEFKMNDYILARKEQHDVFWMNYKWLDLSEQGRENPVSNPRTLIDFTRDTILVDIKSVQPGNDDDDRAVPSFMTKLDMSKVTNLAVQFPSSASAWPKSAATTRACNAALLLPSLKILTVVMGDSGYITSTVKTVRRLVEIGEHFTLMEAISFRFSFRHGHIWQPFNTVNDESPTTIRKFIRCAETAREEYEHMIFWDPKYHVLKNVELKICATAWFAPGHSIKQIINLVPKYPRYSGVAFFTRGFSEKSSPDVKTKIKRPKYVLGFEELDCYAKANADGALRIQCQGLEDIKNLFIQNGEQE